MANLSNDILPAAGGGVPCQSSRNLYYTSGVHPRPADKNYRIVVGIDEAGRGPLAGPVTAAAVTVLQISNLKSQISKIIKIRDSKKMTSRQRERAFELLREHPNVEWGIGRVSEKVIDRINILEATKLAMERAVLNLEKKLGSPADFLLIDGNFGIALPQSQKSIVKGDEKVFLISLASIVAKVTRDRGMLRYHKKCPQYGFNRHKGYGTKCHYDAISRHGICPLHRKTFRLIKNH